MKLPIHITCKHFHVTCAIAWSLCVMILLINVATLENGKQRAGKRWGMSVKKSESLKLELRQLRKQIAWKATRGYVADKVVSIGIPLEKETILAQIP